MAVDKLVDSTQLDSDLTFVANAIRAKSGGSSQLAFPSGFVSEIGNIPSGGGGGEFVVLKSVAITENVNAIKIDYDSTWAAYDAIFITVNAVLTSGDWIYLDFDRTNPIHYMAGNVATHWGVIASLKNGNSWESKFTIYNGDAYIFSGFPEYLYLKCYTATKYYTSGTEIVVYGGKYA